MEHDGASPPGTFGTAVGYSEEDEYVYPTNSSGLHVLTRPSPRHRRASTTVPKPHGDKTQWWKGDSGASTHATSRTTHMYNLRTPAQEESRLVVGSGKKMEVELIGGLDIVLHCFFSLPPSPDRHPTGVGCVGVG